MINLNFKAIFIAVAWSIVARVVGDVTEFYFGWDQTATISILMSVVILWIYIDLEQERETAEVMRTKVRIALDKLEGRRS